MRLSSCKLGINNTQMNCRILPRRYNPLEISSRDRVLNSEIKRSTKIDGMGPFKRQKPIHLNNVDIKLQFYEVKS